MTQQTLREEFEKFLFDYEIEFSNKHQNQDDEELIADFFLARFKEFAERELIKDEEEHRKYCDYGVKYPCTCGAKTRNALRNEQRKILSEKLK